VAVYTWSGRNRDGLLVESRTEAPSAQAVAAGLQEAGITPIRIAEAAVQSERLDPIRRHLLPERVSHEGLIALCRQLQRLSRAGIPILRGLSNLAESTPERKLGTALRQVVESVRDGHELSDALQRHPSVFPSLFVSVVRIGETTGRLDEAFLRLASYLELEQDTRKRLSSALRYPAIVLLTIVAALVVINAFVVPAFARVFESFQADLPLPTRVLIAVSDAMLRGWPVGLVLSIGVALLFRAWLRTDAGRMRYDRAKIEVPILGPILRMATLGRYARSVAMGHGAGIPLLRTLAIAARASDNRFLEHEILEMRGRIERGESLTLAATASGLFSPVALQMIAVGEETGAVEDMHAQIAESYQGEVEYQLRRLVDVLEPTLIVAIGFVVLLLALGVYLPMWDMARVARGG
jgi:MSHA biogenesis protein MshG